MNSLRTLVRSFLRSDEATTVTEYTVVLGLIILVAITAISGIGPAVSGTFTAVDTGVLTGAPL